DYDSWHPEHGEVDVQDIIRTLMDNTAKAKELVAQLPGQLGSTRELCGHGCDRSLDSAILSADAAKSELAAKLDAVAGRILGARERQDTE
ncbi:MAG: S-methyl-5'-thioadenosine phosphorylase, partial [Rhodospirillaceae bacterium]|nr:S-methyl-5'-thioadenosine phosphorylase [Rhodospirillaceae bacterium]